jgi:hypothetical protein
MLCMTCCRALGGPPLLGDANFADRLVVQFELTETCVAFPLPEGSDSCADYCFGAAAALGSGVSVGGSNASLVVDGQTVLQLPIVAFGAAAG